MLHVNEIFFGLTCSLLFLGNFEESFFLASMISRYDLFSSQKKA
jgi:hypothetical protein